MFNCLPFRLMSLQKIVTTKISTKKLTTFNCTILSCYNETIINNKNINRKDIFKNNSFLIEVPLLLSLNNKEVKAKTISSSTDSKNNRFQTFFQSSSETNQQKFNFNQHFSDIKSLSSLKSQMTNNFNHKKYLSSLKKSPQSSSTPTTFTYDLTKNLTYFTLDKNKYKTFNKNTLKFMINENNEIDDNNYFNKNPLVLCFAWMFATKDHLKKYVQIYTNLGFDVITIRIFPFQLLWPVKGSQIVASDVLKFLENNMNYYGPIVIHGFSVGGYVFGEVMALMENDLKRYEKLINKFYAQIWDSAADMPELSVGFPIAVFPDKPMLQKLFRNYINYHIKKFHEQATKHYIKSSQMFHNTLLRSPALFFLSKNDPIGAEKSNLSVKNDWENLGIKCTWKCWDRSKHVLHLKFHKDEYMKLLMEHIETNVLKRLSSDENNYKLKAKL